MANLLQEAMISLETKMGEHFKSLQDDIGKLRLEMRNMGQNMVDTFNQQMNILEKRLDNKVTVLEDKTNESINHVESCVKYQISNITGKEIEVVQEICKSQEIEKEVYESRLDELEQYSKRNAVRLLGVEENSVEDCDKIAREIFEDRLAVDIFKLTRLIALIVWGGNNKKVQEPF